MYANGYNHAVPATEHENLSLISGLNKGAATLNQGFSRLIKCNTEPVR